MSHMASEWGLHAVHIGGFVLAAVAICTTVALAALRPAVRSSAAAVAPRRALPPLL